MRVGVFLLAVALAGPVNAQSSLGITGATLSFGGLSDEASRGQANGSASLDVAITQVHGLQGDLSFEDTAYGTIGRLTGHVYMDPAPGQKYGLFVAMSDLDGRSLNWVDFGAEGQINVGEWGLASVRAGLGQADQGGLDYIFGGLAYAHALTPDFEVEVHFDVTDFDETDLRATSLETGITARYAPIGQPWGVYAEVIHSALTGRDGGASSLRLGAGLTVSLGTAGGISANTRHFRDHDPVAPMVRRGLK